MKNFVDNLVFDNRTTQDLFCENNLNKPFYADIVKRWALGENIPDDKRKLIVQILIFHPEYVFHYNKTQEFIDLIKESLLLPEFRFYKNPEKGLYLYTLLYFLLKSNKYKEAFNLFSVLKRLSVKYYKTKTEVIKISKVKVEYDVYDFFSNRKAIDFNEIDKLTMAYVEIIGKIISAPELFHIKPDFNLNDLPFPLLYIDEGDCSGLRTNALYLVEDKNYEKAKIIYLILLIARFEISGTLVHLARLAILQDNYEESATYTELAERHPEDAADYIKLRILWFRLCFAMLRNNDEDEIIIILTELKKRFAEHYQLMEWSMQSVLECIKTKISNANYELLVNLIEAMSSEKVKAKLEAMKLWKKKKYNKLTIALCFGKYFVTVLK
jgi:hypothetical protein